AEYDVFLGHIRRIDLYGRIVLCRRSDRRLDRLCAVEFRRSCDWSRSGIRSRPLDHKYRHILYSLATRRPEFYYDNPQYAGERHVADADAADLLGLVYDGDTFSAVLPGATGCGFAASFGSQCRNELFYAQHL